MNLLLREAGCGHLVKTQVVLQNPFRISDYMLAIEVCEETTVAAYSKCVYYLTITGCTSTLLSTSL